MAPNNTTNKATNITVSEDAYAAYRAIMSVANARECSSNCNADCTCLAANWFRAASVALTAMHAERDQ